MEKRFASENRHVYTAANGDLLIILMDLETTIIYCKVVDMNKRKSVWKFALELSIADNLLTSM